MAGAFLFAQTCVGHSHVATGKVCQDASLAHEGAGYALIAVADGHGGTPYFRSDRGARFACRATLEAVAEFVPALEAHRLEPPAEREAVVGQLCKHILLRWHTLVEADCASQPMAAQELEALPARYRREYEAGLHPERAYGTTLIFALHTPRYTLAVRNGDGQCVMVDGAGGFSAPIPWNDNCIMNTTTSLCQEDAIAQFRHYYTAESPAALFIGSDGVDDSYASMDEVYALYRSLCIEANTAGTQELEAQVAELLPGLTRLGSGDDVSVAGLMLPRRLAPLQPVFEAAQAERADALRLQERQRQLRIAQSRVHMGQRALDRAAPEAAEGLRQALAEARQALAALEAETPEAPPEAGSIEEPEAPPEGFEAPPEAETAEAPPEAETAEAPPEAPPEGAPEAEPEAEPTEAPEALPEAEAVPEDAR